MQVEIIKETIKDQTEVFAINSSAFETNAEAKLVDALRTSKAFIPNLSLVAMFDDRVIGHILFTEIKIIESVNGAQHISLALAPMAVLEKFQNLGIGSKLVKNGLEQANKLGYKSVIVLGHSKYYPKFGFIPASKFNIKPPFNVPDNVFMAIELEKDALKKVSGVVQYPKEFEMV